MAPLVIELPWPAGLFPNERLPDFQKRRQAADHKQTAFLLARSAIAKRVKRGEAFEVPESGDLAIHFTACAKPRGRMGDDDGVIAAMKWARDGIAEALRIDDKRFITQPVTWGPRSPYGAVFVEVRHAEC